MAVYLNRTLSIMSGNLASPSHENGLDRSLHNIAYENSPLQIFVKAKKKINDIFGEIEEYVIETAHFMDEHNAEVALIDKAEAEQFQSYVHKVAAIRQVLNRDHMKVAFFGRTSNGKSSVINAMLREKILPSGIGHTTNCFCQVEGVDGNEAYLVKEGSDERLNVTNVQQLANALCSEKLCESSKIRIFWPRERCSLLRDDVVFVDSPGVDVSPNLDDWIDNHCLDADVFVLVLNSESTMTLAEKQFFHTVSKRLSKPNVFILMNRWDASANEPEFLESVKSQHQERCIDFLVKELKVANMKEADERVFFVSARETLQARICESKGQPPNNGALAEGFSNRYFEFQDFERKFEECISKSAVKTKFEQHSSRGKTIANEMHQMLDEIFERAGSTRNEKLKQKAQLTDRIGHTEQELMSITREMKLKIHNMVEEVEQKVSKALNEEIWRLNVLVDEFNLPFHTEPLVLNVYKKEINGYVENGLGSNLKSRLSTALAMNIETAQREMTERMHSLIPTESIKQQSKQILARTQPFEMFYTLNCQNLCSDFHEDLEFKFSWGITAMIQRFTGKAKKQQNKGAIMYNRQNSTASIPNVLSPVTNEPNGPQSMCLIQQTGISQEQISVISRFAMASIGSQGTVGGLVVAGFLLKTVGWRVLVGIGALYGCVYFYERLSWNNSAKERTFKEQYVRHATRKLKLIVDLTSSNCSHQVQQELSGTFARLCRVVDTATSDMTDELKKIEGELAVLEANQKNLKLLRNKANYITSELEIFDTNYIRPN
ncbi:transmembrane GTPase Marf isoform X2 [Sitodiplosis mosellana]|uniref:transmembrane GTPase Marf isoform X2 n=1 Tax=Sitodiplosis mosellana TaxID=263140 RepID=UPI002443DB51|nr:transmembrane GTPase Marf isoform X2 [Sitodiplosis mosellana]XP_055319698.1 transmembrane GTPase Marf isoform X2 [Sitodiplosis mosellana]XP_055319709.1 transmembrane GTPase Marf isoform X2 [Sitodiplosis mosellana]